MATIEMQQAALRHAFATAAGADGDDAVVQSPGVDGLCVMFRNVIPAVNSEMLLNIFESQEWHKDYSFNRTDFGALCRVLGVDLPATDAHAETATIHDSKEVASVSPVALKTSVASSAQVSKDHEEVGEGTPLVFTAQMHRRLVAQACGHDAAGGACRCGKCEDSWFASGWTCPKPGVFSV